MGYAIGPIVEREVSRARTDIASDIDLLNGDLDWLSMRTAAGQSAEVPKSFIKNLESFIRAIVQEEIHKDKGAS